MARSLLSRVFLGVCLMLVFASAGIAGQYNESPMLKELVEAGKLPPVDQRLPEEPFVVGPGVLASEDQVDWEVGVYGGPFRQAHHTPDLDFDVYIMGTEPLLRGQGTGVIGLQGNLVSEYQVSEDNTEFTFTLRKGLRWSDGVPVTTEDVRFAVEDVMFNTTINPAVPTRYRTGGRPDGEVFTLDIVDDYTFVIGFAEPYGAFVTETAVAGWWVGYDALLKPSHYLKRFHIDYTPLTEMRPYLDQEELDDEWWQLFDIKDVRGTGLTSARAIGFPVLRPWERVEGPSGIGVYRRNPYYFKVDIAGNQLPYMDEIHSYEVNDIAMVEMMAITGETDWLRGEVALASMPLYRSNEERGGYETRLLEMHIIPTNLFLNPAHPDETWRAVVNNVEFRRALNMAIDREEIVEVVYFGMAELPKLVPSNYNPEEAQRILDALGMQERDSDGYRLAPDGSQFEIYVEYAELAADFTPILELVADYFSNVGVRTSLRRVSGELRGQLIGSNEIMASILWRSAPMWHGLVNRDYLPMLTWGAEWRRWYDTAGTAGIEPPDYIKELFALDEAALRTVPSTPENDEAVAAILNWFYENVPYFVMVENAGYPLLISKRLKNVPHSGLGIDANYIGEQYFFAE